MSDSDPRINMAAIAAANPKVDAEQLREANQLVDGLRRSGLAPTPGYKIDSPYERRPVETPDVLAHGNAPTKVGSLMRAVGRDEGA